MNPEGRTPPRNEMEPCRLADCAGFTLIELIVTITVAGILLAIAVPNFKDVIRNNRMATTANEVVTTLSLARSEAVKRGQRVTVCRSTDWDQADASCNTGSGGWETGWIAFVDLDANGERDGGEALLKVHEPLQGGMTLRTGVTFSDWISYRPNGTSQGNGGLASDTFRLCDNRGTSSSYGIEVIATGRASSQKGGAASCP
jgi:type IV fimbrial biogenesis protein FimT